jgi:cytochrome b involved in lipid metabolism
MRIFAICTLILTRTMATDIRAPRANREKVMLKPGFHLIDWMKLTQVSTDMRSPGPLRKISLAELATHKSQFDAWTAYKGKVYNITQYIAYHPGGAKTLMSGAGMDCTAQFNKFHAWVNAESMLSKCLIGVLMSEEAPIPEAENEADDEDGDDVIKKPAASAVREIRIISLGGESGAGTIPLSKAHPKVDSPKSKVHEVTVALEALDFKDGK